MSEIYYTELGALFGGIGIMALFLVLAYGFYQLVRIWKAMADVEERYSFLELFAINGMASKKGIDLEKEITKRQIVSKKNIRKKIEEEVYDDLFNKDREVKK